MPRWWRLDGGASLRALVAAVLLAAMLTPSAAYAAEPPAVCVEGLAREASIDRPHFVDAANDTATATGPLDLRAVWISQRDVPAWFETWKHYGLLSFEGGFKFSRYPRAYRANIAVASIPPVPFTATYVVEFDTNRGPHFVAAERMPTEPAATHNPWRFQWGMVEADGTLTYKGWSTGEVDGDVIGIDLVGWYQSWNEDYSENSIAISRVRSTIPLGTDYDAVYDDVPMPAPHLVSSDEGTAQQSCKAVLWAEGERPDA